MDIGGWLRGLGLQRYEQAFRENEIDLRVLPELTADDLKELGVAAIGHRRLLLKAIADLATLREHPGFPRSGLRRWRGAFHPTCIIEPSRRCCGRGVC